MPSFSSLVTSNTGIGFFYEKSPRHATYNFNQDGLGLYRNHPRFPFEYYISINLNNVSTAKEYIGKFYDNTAWKQMAPLVKTVDMPNMKIDTTSMNQYNRKRISQTKVVFDPVKIVFHDVADGKTLKLWDMYYRYYFADGIEPGKNDDKDPPLAKKKLSLERFIPKINKDILSLPSSIGDLFSGGGIKKKEIPTNKLGDKHAVENIVEDKLNNHYFGFNLPRVENVRSLIQSIDIYQVHGGRFNRVTLVNPRVSAFTHDTLDYAGSGETLEVSFTFEYEYAYYTIQNMKLGGTESNNTSSKEPFENGEFLELPALAFNTALLDFIESNNPLLGSDNPILRRVGKNVQSSIGGVTGAFMSDKVVRKASASALNGMANISPKPVHTTSKPAVTTRPFASAAPVGAVAPTNTTTSAAPMYKDVNRVGGTNV